MIVIDELTEDNQLVFVNEMVDIFNNTVYQSYNLKKECDSYIVKFEKKMNKKISIKNEYRAEEIRVEHFNNEEDYYNISGITEEGFRFSFEKVIHCKIIKDENKED